MADPVTLGVIITGLVGAYKAYADYKAAVAKAGEQKEAAPAKSAEAAKGEQAAPLIKAAVLLHGDDKDRNALAQFEDEPDDYRGVLESKLARLAERNPAFAQQLQTLAQQANIQTGGVQGAVNVSGQGKIYGPTAGTNTGTMSGTYTFGADKDDT
jgi:hypothetical protein